MQYVEHHFQPDLRNEMRCDLCGEHVASSQHPRAKTLHRAMRAERQSRERNQYQLKI